MKACPLDRSVCDWRCAQPSLQADKTQPPDSSSRSDSSRTAGLPDRSIFGRVFLACPAGTSICQSCRHFFPSSTAMDLFTLRHSIGESNIERAKVYGARRKDESNKKCDTRAAARQPDTKARQRNTKARQRGDSTSAARQRDTKARHGGGRMCESIMGRDTKARHGGCRMCESIMGRTAKAHKGGRSKRLSVRSIRERANAHGGQRKGQSMTSCRPPTPACGGQRKTFKRACCPHARHRDPAERRRMLGAEVAEALALMAWQSSRDGIIMV